MAPDKLRPHDHAGAEFIYVLQGTLSVHIGDDEHALEAGDSCTSTRARRSYRRSGGRACRAIVVTTA